MNDPSLGSDLLAGLAEEFAERFRRGERPALTEYADRYPELADQIRDLFPALVVMERFGSVGGQATGSFAGMPAAGDPAPTQLGEYRILREVARGGMGIVYEAVQESLGRHVALKVFPAARLMSPTDLERFRREARAAARLHHTNIVPVFGVGEHDGVHYFAMQLIRGQSLDRVLHELRQLRRRGLPPTDADAPRAPSLSVTLARGLLSGRFPDADASTQPGGPIAGTPARVADAASPATGDPGGPSLVILGDHSELGNPSTIAYARSVARIGVQVAEALAYSHQQGILHRDIKPANLLLDTRGTVWVSDFGLVKEEGTEELTTEGDLVGTLRYMAPERFQSQSDPRGDVYGLGVTLYELLTLRPVFEATSRAKLIERVLHESPALPRRLDRHIPRDMETIILKAIAKEPGRRYATATALAEDLRRFLADRPVLARRSTAAECVARWCRRNPAVALLTLSTAALLMLVAAVATIGYLQTSDALARMTAAQRETARQRQDALRERDNANRNLYDSSVGEAQALRLARVDGYRRLAWPKLLQALRLETPARDVDELRYEAVAGMGDFVGLPPTVFTDFPADIYTAALSPDGTLLALGLTDSTVSLRRLDTGAEVARLRDHRHPITSLAFAPAGRPLVSGDGGGTIKVWEPGTAGRWACARTMTTDGPVCSVAITPDGTRLAACRWYASSIPMWDLSEGNPTGEFRVPDGQRLRCMSLSPDGTLLAAGYWSRPDGVRSGIVVWDVAMRQPGRPLAPVLALAPAAIAFSPSGHHLVCVGQQGADIFDLDGPEPRRLASVQTNEPTSAVFSRDDQVLVVPDCQLGLIRLWSIAALREIATLKLPGGPSPVAHDRTGRRTAGGPHSLAVGPEGKTLVAVAPRSVALWDLAGTPEKRVLAGHDGGIPSLAFSPDGTRLASASKDKTVRIWDPLTGRALKRLDGFRGPLQAISYSPDGRWLATAGQADDLQIWDVESSGHREIPDHGLTTWLWSVGFSPDGRHLAACGSGGLALWRLSPDGPGPGTPPGLRKVARPTTGPTTSLCFSSDGRLLAWAETRQSLRLWDVEHSRALPLPPAKLAGYVLSVAFLDTKRLSFVDEALVVEVWDAIDGRRVSSFGVAGAAARRGIFLGPVIAASKDGRLLASQDGRSATVWDIEGRRLLFALPEEPGVTWSLAWSPDNRLLAVGSSDGGLAIWDLPKVRSQLADLGLDWGRPSRPGIRPQ